MNISAMCLTRAHLIVTRDHLVALDLSETIALHDPTALVIVRHDIADAAAALGTVNRIEVAFVSADPEVWVNSALARSIRHLGGRVVLMGNDAEARGEAQGLDVLHRPFSQGVVLAHLEGLTQVETCPCRLNKG